LIRGRGISYIREASPPFDPPFKERELLERSFASLFPTLPLPLIREESGA